MTLHKHAGSPGRYLSSPLILSDEEEPGAVRFNALLYGLELAWLDGKKFYGRNWAQKKNTQKNTLQI